MSFDTLLPLIKKTQSPLSPADFQQIVNVVFHDIEAEHYDAIHKPMWDSLQQQIDFLADDITSAGPVGENLRMLDIGCGTGLSTELLLLSKLGRHISHITLLDTSPNMLKQAEDKIKKWEKPYVLVNADVSQLNEKFDVIIVSSVLHHIPDLGAFLSKIDSLQKTGGILVHLQDPNGDFMQDAEYHQRFEQYLKAYRSNEKKSVKDWLPDEFKETLKRWLGKKTYLDRVNDKLLEMKVIKKRMTSKEIWSVTDIHVEDLPFSIGSGISLDFLKKNLAGYELVNHHAYGFFGFPKSELLEEFQPLEQQLIDQKAKNGRYLSASWIKK